MVGPYSRVIHKFFIYTSAVEVSFALAALTTLHGPKAQKAPKAPPPHMLFKVSEFRALHPASQIFSDPSSPNPCGF